MGGRSSGALNVRTWWFERRLRQGTHKVNHLPMVVYELFVMVAPKRGLGSSNFVEIDIYLSKLTFLLDSDSDHRQNG
jgi:hypothetical protein